jgi:hypothetical protein
MNEMSVSYGNTQVGCKGEKAFINGYKGNLSFPRKRESSQSAV